MNKNSDLQILGWLGVLLVLVAYLLLNLGLISSRLIYYLIANFIGAVFIIYRSVLQKRLSTGCFEYYLGINYSNWIDCTNSLVKYTNHTTYILIKYGI